MIFFAHLQDKNADCLSENQQGLLPVHEVEFRGEFSGAKLMSFKPILPQLKLPASAIGAHSNEDQRMTEVHALSVEFVKRSF